ncbi:DNA alkylation repair protein [Candidatus Saccharibacteria bacterium]|nr:DNA alkylation repair protein [Candidatus Saccharibacteria bacterium]
MTAQDFKDKLAQHASDADAIFLQRFFKTAPGEYGEGDIFIGARVPMTRKVCRDFKTLPLAEIEQLLYSPIHEHRLAATIIMSGQYKKADFEKQQHLFDLYLKALRDGRINNWDIVDTSCEHIVGAYACQNNEQVLFELAKRDDLWSKRVAIVSCFAWLRNKQLGPTIELAKILWPETHDLLQKAVGWMLREVGNYVDQQLLLDFLDDHAHIMPRTELRYAIEKLSPKLKKHYMASKSRSAT